MLDIEGVEDVKDDSSNLSQEDVDVPFYPSGNTPQEDVKGDTSEPTLPPTSYSEYQNTEKSEKKVDDTNKVYEPWTIIDTYFRDNSYYKTQHQIDSFNEFITSEDNGIRQIIKRNNPLRIFKGEGSDGSFNYEMEIYFGERLMKKQKNYKLV